MSKIIEVHKVRTVGASKEHLIHFPKECLDMYYSMQYDSETGVVRYVPIVEKVPGDRV
jgi:hypothetical protein